MLQALQKAIDAVKPGLRYREVGDIISHHVGTQGFQVVRSYCGHGICDLFHCAPNLPHYAHNKVQPRAILLMPSLNLFPTLDSLLGWPSNLPSALKTPRTELQCPHIACCRLSES